MPFKCEKVVTRSGQDQAAITLIEEKTTHVEVDGVLLLLHKADRPLLLALKEAVMPNLWNTEQQLAKVSEQAKACSTEIQKLVDAGYVKGLNPEEINQEGEMRYIPHHMVSRDNKNGLSFIAPIGTGARTRMSPSCLDPPLEHLSSYTSGRILSLEALTFMAMFHQVHLLPKDPSPMLLTIASLEMA